MKRSQKQCLHKIIKFTRNKFAIHCMDNWLLVHQVKYTCIIITNYERIFISIMKFFSIPGSGKTTYCHKINEFYKELERNVAVVNLDPANEQMNYNAQIDIVSFQKIAINSLNKILNPSISLCMQPIEQMQLITVADVMEHLKLGPNGALVYCMEYLEENFDWLLSRLKQSTANYFIFDCPGQVELYTHHQSMSRIFNRLNALGYYLCTVQLIDSHYCSEPTKFISTLLLSLNSMLQMGLPQVNVLSKADLLKQFEAKLAFNIDFYTEVLDLKYLLESLDNSIGMKKYKKLNAAIVSLVEDYSLVTFQPLDVNRRDSLLRLKKLIDQANGYVYGAAEEKSINSMLACAVGAENDNDKFTKDYQPYL